MAATPAFESPRDRSPSAFSADGESTYTGNVNTNKVLRIKRTVSGLDASIWLASGHVKKVQSLTLSRKTGRR